MSRTGVLHRSVADTPIAIVDFETTGLTPGIDRVVEVSVVRKEPGQASQLAFDTLINPERPMGATEIHRITDADVSDAPRFEEIASQFLDAISGCAVAAYNVYFDMRFADYELRKVGVRNQPPHFCLMYLRPMLGIGKRCRLSEACAYHGLIFEDQHITSSDCYAAAQLMELYLEAMGSAGVVTFEDLASLRAYKFTTSFVNAPLTASICGAGVGKTKMKPRGCAENHAVRGNVAIDSGDAPGESLDGLRAYWDTLRDAITDLEMSDAELLDLAARRSESNLSEEQVRAVHTKIYMSVLAEYAEDWRITGEECEVLRRLHSCLRTAGWAPGDRGSPLQAGVNIKEKQFAASKTGPLAGKTLVVSGTLEQFTRGEIENRIKELGGKAASSVSKNTDYLVAGEKAGSKLDKAKKLGVQVLSEEEFVSLIKS